MGARSKRGTGVSSRPGFGQSTSTSSCSPKWVRNAAVFGIVSIVVPVLDALWSENPTQWETLYAQAGPVIEPTLVRRFPGLDGALLQSAVRLLGQTGTAECIPMLEGAEAGANAAMKVLIDNAITAIRPRIEP